MNQNFTREFFQANRARLRTLFTGAAPIVITANGLLQRSGDNVFPYRQDSNFWYLTGISEPDIILVIDKSKEYLIVPSRSTSREAFDGSVDFNDLKTISGVDEVLDETTGWKRLTQRIKKAQHVATLSAAPTYISAHGFYANPARSRLIKKLRTENKSLELLDLRRHLAKMRMIKQPQELAAITEAVNLTIDAFNQIKQEIPKAKFEYELEAAMTNTFGQHGKKHAYQPIIASGHNACTLHYVSNNNPIGRDGLILFDVGAEVDGYAADISRTYAVSEPSKRERAVWKAVLDVQDYALEQLKPGVLMSDYEKNIETFMGEKLRELGLIRTIEHDTVRKYYPHATSHYLGLDVHDAGDYEQPLEPGMVLTVEPGIYIPEEGIGIRIEDDVVVTKSGIKNISENLSREL